MTRPTKPTPTKPTPAPQAPRTPAGPNTWPAAVAKVVEHLRPYLGIALLVLVVVLSSSVAFVLVRSCRVTVGALQISCRP
jgi:hypothetical protein